MSDFVPPPPAPALPPSHPLRIPNRIVVKPDQRQHEWLVDPFATSDPPRQQCQVCGAETLRPEPRLNALMPCTPQEFVSVLVPPPPAPKVKWGRVVDVTLVPPMWKRALGPALFAAVLLVLLFCLWRFT